MSRNVAFRALVGSHNYNLNDENSDLDYKEFVIPSFEDLYKGQSYKKSSVTESIDIETHDIRKFVSLLLKSNPAYLEVLFSKDFEFGENLSHMQKSMLLNIISYKNEIVQMNLLGFYNACLGQAKQKLGNLEKGTEGTVNLVEKFGYDTKQAQHAYRMLNLIERFHDSKFLRFEKSLRYYEYDNNILKMIKEGFFTLEQFRKIAESKLELVESLKDDYKLNHEINDGKFNHIIDYINDSVEKIVKVDIANSIK